MSLTHSTLRASRARTRGARIAALLATAAIAGCSHGAKGVRPIAPPPSAGYTYMFKPTEAPATPDQAAPAILEVDVNAQQLVAPGPLSVRVLTTTAVQTVTASAYGHSFQIPPARPGTFALASQLPTVPFFIHGRPFAIQLTAKSADGRTATTTVPLSLK